MTVNKAIILSSPVYDCKDFEKVPLVDAAATLGEDGSLSIFAVNRSMDHDSEREKRN